MPTHYHDAGIAPRTNTYAYGAEGKKRKMPYAKKSQAKAVLANTDPNNPRHAEARMHAKDKLQKPRKKKNGLAPGHKMMGM